MSERTLNRIAKTGTYVNFSMALLALQVALREGWWVPWFFTGFFFVMGVGYGYGALLLWERAHPLRKDAP